MQIEEEIERTKEQMESVRPRSKRRMQLELRLRDLRTQQLQGEATIGNAYRSDANSGRYSISTWLGSWFARTPPRIPLGKPNSLNAGIP